ncbi:MAG: glycosyltransferase family 4 protein [Caldilineaceae bacterium SB0665_bin_25]|nr:glycosyltransferase family 4 protein [Caldilineaceae bacterium SB0665_bin_25]
MNIVLLTMDFPPTTGGVQQYLFELSRRIGRSCYLTVVVPNGNPLHFRAEPFHLASVPSTMPFHFARVLASIRPHLTIVGHAHPRLLLPAAVLRRRYIALAYGNDFEAAQVRWHAPIFNRLLTSADSLVTISRANAQRLRELGLPTSEILYPGTDPDRFVPLTSPPVGPPVLLTVARLVPRKGIDTVLRALPSLLDRYPKLQYWIVGDGPARASLAQLAREMGLLHAVQFKDSVSDAELPEVYRRATIFVMPSRADYYAGSVEGFGIVYLEASASGLPVVAARSGGAAEAVLENETGLLVPPDDPAALAQALHRLLDDPDMRQRMGRAGRRWVETEMNWDRVGRQFLSIIDRAL